MYIFLIAQYPRLQNLNHGIIKQDRNLLLHEYKPAIKNIYSFKPKGCLMYIMLHGDTRLAAAHEQNRRL